MKKALILSPFFYPELISTGKYNTDIAQSLVDVGYEVTVLCSHPIYPMWVPCESCETLHGMTIIRGGKSNRYPSNPMLRRLVLETWFALFVFRKLRSFKTDFDVVIPILPPSLMGVSLGFFKHKIRRVVGIVHDLQAVHLSASGGRFKKLIATAINKVEKYSFDSCDSIIYLSGEMRTIASEKFSIPLKKSHIVYPFVNITDFLDNGRLDHIFDRSKKSVVYSGAIGDKQCPDALYELASRLVHERDDTLFYFFSGGPNFLRLKEKNRNPGIIFSNLVEKEAIGELLYRSDIQILPQAPGTAAASLPSKLPNILASGTRLFVITDVKSEIEMLLGNLESCVISNTWDTSSNYIMLNSMLNESVDKIVDSGLMSLFVKDRLVELIDFQEKAP